MKKSDLFSRNDALGESPVLVGEMPFIVIQAPIISDHPVVDDVDDEEEAKE